MVFESGGSNMNQLFVEGIVRSCASTLSEALHVYWPTAGANEMAERNLSLHLAGACQRAGFHVYGEGNRQGVTNERFDLIGVSPSARTLIVAECKRLMKKQGAAGMAGDVSRIQTFKMHSGDDYVHPALEVVHRFGVVMATTWEEEFARWFLEGENYPDPDQGLAQLWDAVPRQDALWGACVLQHFVRREGPRAGEDGRQWLVYAVFKF